MKKIRDTTKVVLLLAFLILGSSISAQTPPPPPPNQGHGSTGNKAPGDSGAPIGNGTFILLALAAAYAGRKVYTLKAAETQE
jgi:hypothetical protein